GSGRIVRPKLDEVALLPDRPYLAPGTLRESLVGVADGGRPRDHQVWDALQAVGVDGAVRRAGGLDVERDWDETLSLEEQRLVGLARVLLAEPRFAVLARLESGIGSNRSASVLAAVAARGVGYLVLDDAPFARGGGGGVGMTEIAPAGRRYESPAGLAVAVNANGSIRRIEHGDVLLNLFPGSEIEGGPANLYLRRLGAAPAWTPLL